MYYRMREKYLRCRSWEKKLNILRLMENSAWTTLLCSFPKSSMILGYIDRMSKIRLMVNVLYSMCIRLLSTRLLHFK